MYCAKWPIAKRPQLLVSADGDRPSRRLSAFPPQQQEGGRQDGSSSIYFTHRADPVGPFEVGYATPTAVAGEA